MTAGANGGPYNLIHVCSGQTRRPPEAATPEATEIHTFTKGLPPQHVTNENNYIPYQNTIITNTGHVPTPNHDAPFS